MSPDTRHAWVLFLLLLGHNLPARISSMPLGASLGAPGAGLGPVCARWGSECQPASLPELFDRVIQHATRIHSLSTDLHNQEQNVFASRNQMGRAQRRCHTSHILPPAGKENVQSLAREQLTAVILKLLLAWREPLSQFHRNAGNAQASSRARDMSHMVHQLRSGVEKVAERMQLLGMLSGFRGTPPPVGAPHPPSSGRDAPLSDHELLPCFRRDMDKVHSLLRILKCRIFPEHGC